MNKTQAIIYLLISLALVSSLISSFIQNSWSAFFLILVVIILSLTPIFLKYKFDIEIGKNMQLSFVAFLFATIFLGEIRNFYDQYPWWDSVLHFWAGFGLTVFGLAILMQIYKQRDLENYPFPSALYAFSFTGMFLGAWEIFEFVADSLQLAENKMQPSLADTMYDLIIGYAAAFIFAVFGYRYLRWREKNMAASAVEEMKLEVKDTEKG